MKAKFLLVVLLIVATPVLFYNSRKVPELGSDVEVTQIPQDVRKVLSAQSTKPEIAVRVPILLYHYVEYVQDKKDTIRQSLNITPDVLTAQIETLKGDGYNFVTMSDVADALSGKASLPTKPIVLTFDDGYMDFYTDVFPILKKEQVKAVEYVIADFLNRPNFMFIFQLQEVAKSPLVEIGAHTMDHLWLKGMTKDRAEFQIAQSRKEIQDIIKLPVNSFAYPYGAFDLQAIDLTKSAGFSNAVSTIPGIEHTQNTEFFMYRLRPGYRTGEVLLTYLKQISFSAY